MAKMCLKIKTVKEKVNVVLLHVSPSRNVFICFKWHSLKYVRTLGVQVCFILFFRIFFCHSFVLIKPPYGEVCHLFPGCLYPLLGTNGPEQLIEFKMILQCKRMEIFKWKMLENNNNNLCFISVGQLNFFYMYIMYFLFI